MKILVNLTVAAVLVAFTLSPLFICGGCASQQIADQPTTPEIWRTFDTADDTTLRTALRTMDATEDLGNDVETDDCVVDGDSADCVPVRVSQITILVASAEEMEAAIEAAELTALCPHPHRASTGDRDAWICEP